MNPDEMKDTLAEIRERTTRMETRLVQLGEHMGVNLRNRHRIDVEPTRESVVVYVDALDISFSRIANDVQDSQHWANAKPGTHHVQVRMGVRRDYYVVGDVVVVKAPATAAVARSPA